MGIRCPFRHMKGDKTIVCKHWLRGLCKKGDDCDFLHVYNMAKMPECYFYSKHGECSNKECLFLHVDPASKVQDCAWYARGFCRNGRFCTSSVIFTQVHYAVIVTCVEFVAKIILMAFVWRVLIANLRSKFLFLVTTTLLVLDGGLCLELIKNITNKDGYVITAVSIHFVYFFVYVCNLLG